MRARACAHSELHPFLQNGVCDEDDLQHLLLLSVAYRRRKRNKKRTIWVREIFFRRQQRGEFHTLLQEMRLNDSQSHFCYLRMSAKSVSLNFRIGRSTVCGIVRETCRAIWKALQPSYVKAPSTEDEWNGISNLNVCGLFHIMLGLSMVNTSQFKPLPMLVPCSSITRGLTQLC